MSRNFFLNFIKIFFLVILLSGISVAVQPKHTITIISSASCHGCKKFYDKKFEEIEEYAQDHGIQIKHFPFAVDQKTLMATALTYALGEEKQHELYLEFLNRQDEWYHKGAKGTEALKNIALELDIPEADIDTIMYAQEYDGTLERLRLFVEKHKIEYVPCILIDDQVIVEADLAAIKKAFKGNS